jgi:hypothetical protein
MTRVRIRPEWKRQLPVVALLSTYRDWKVEMSDDLDPVFTFSLRFRILRGENDTLFPSIMDKREVDAHEVRQRLFSVETPEQALVFFRGFGPWQLNGELWAKQADPVSFSQLIRQRRGWQEALVNKDKSDNLSFSAEFRERQQVWIAACKDVLDCVRTTVILDRASRWRWCARKDCTAPPFECGNRGKKYHDETCAETQGKRNQRDKQRKRRT